MFYKWGGSDILSISTFNHYSRILKVVAVILLQKKIRDYLGTFPKRGGGAPIPKTLSKFTNIVLEMFLKNGPTFGKNSQIISFFFESVPKGV